MRWENLSLLKPKDQLKFVVADEADYEFAKGVLERHSPDTEVVFSPVGGMDLQPLAERVLADGLDARVLPQLHKIIWGDRRSV